MKQEAAIHRALPAELAARVDGHLKKMVAVWK